MLIKIILSISILISLWVLGIQHLIQQNCHSINSHMLVYHRINTQIKNVRKISFLFFLKKHGCLGFYKKITKDSFKFYGLKSSNITLELSLPGKL